MLAISSNYAESKGEGQVVRAVRLVTLVYYILIYLKEPRILVLKRESFIS
jgi:hypothetical protein